MIGEALQVTRRGLSVTAGLCALLGVAVAVWLWPSPGPKIARHLTLTDNGKSVTVRVGDRVQLVLDQAWAIGSAPTGSALHQETHPKFTRADGPCGPTPVKCGSTSADYIAIALGESSITALGNCGEVVSDCPYERSHFRVTVAVSP
ncbi:hypothetical protein GCM10009839_33280 [Catenulispora yoronensis]|uniref:Uncharacterized protein n=1 Tax=Catenulispora yoronensis TaxID=450799 RepID=A0ABP5FRZ8_9ACTN